MDSLNIIKRHRQSCHNIFSNWQGQMTSDNNGRDLNNWHLHAFPNIDSEEAFRNWISQFMYSLYPFGSAFFGRGRTHSLGVNIECEVCINLSESYRSTLRSPSGGIHSSPLQNWFRTLEPQTYNASIGDAAICPIWADNFRRFGFSNLVIHGKVDAGDGLLTVFGLYNIPQGIFDELIDDVGALANAVHMAMRQVPIATKESKGRSTQDIAALTLKEAEIMSWMRAGKTNQEIGAILSISPNTVRNHVANIMKKLSAFNRTQAVLRFMGLPGRPSEESTLSPSTKVRIPHTQSE